MSSSNITKDDGSLSTTVIDPPTITTTTTSTTTSTLKATKTEREKMLSGEYYQAFDKDLIDSRQRAKLLCHTLNQTCPLKIEKRKSILKELLFNGLKEDCDDEKEKIIVQTMWIESPLHVDYGQYLKVGTNFYANHGCTILDCNYVTFGDNCLLGPHVCISAATHPIDPTSRKNGNEYAQPITIGNNVWIGANATVCPNVTIGDNVVVGAGAVVTKIFPSNVVIGGVPAKILKYVGNHQESDFTQGEEVSDHVSDSEEGSSSVHIVSALDRSNISDTYSC